MPVRKKRIELLISDILRKHQVVQPPVAVEEIAIKYDLQIRFQPLQSDISGFLYQDGQQTIIGVNSSHPKVRQRFTIAHELGHFILHQIDPLHVDRAVQARFRNTLSKQGTDVDEIEANLFAAELLMPRDLLASNLKHIKAVDILDEDSFIQLAHSYQVSAQALLLRLVNLGYIEQ